MKPGTRTALFVAALSFISARLLAATPSVEHDTAKRFVTMADAERHLVLRLNYDGKCVLEKVSVGGRDVVPEATGVCSAIQVANQWHTTRSGIPAPQVKVVEQSVTVSGIRFGGGGVEVVETWSFTVHADRIVWRIDRTYLSGGTVEDTYFAGWDFNDMSTWTGALLGTGGVAWGKFLDKPNATYGAHTGPVTFWNRENRACLRIVPAVSAGDHIAVRFSRQPSGVFSFCHSVTRDELRPKHALNRFLAERQDLWAPFQVSPGEIRVEYTLSGLNYDEEYVRGRFQSLSGDSIREVLNTIARVGVVDRRFHGSNNWRLGYAVLHEPWIAQLGLAIDDPYYFQGCAETLDYQRDHAIDEQGRVKSRWCYNDGDALRGTFDRFGFYETQWGMLMDSQPSFVINVCEQFDFTGDLEWVHGQKATCERVLNYMFRRDADGDGLLEVLTDTIAAKKASDWIDVIWASHENAFVNAQVFCALGLWAGVEELLGDSARAETYRQAAAKLKQRFNQTTAEGGFWEPKNRWYVYWRDKDDSIHGNNLVIPVNFMAIAYGLCDDAMRREAILGQVETLMQKEGLFFWPLCFFSYAEGEAHPGQFPFPTYENGDLFLAWGEVGTRAYAKHDPRIAVKYIRNVLDRYERDGLAFQRYYRKSQSGAGDDILSNNANPVVGLYRNIYGLQPKHDRLYLEPHLTPELNGTQLKYWLRGKVFRIDLSVDDYAVAVDGFTVRDPKPFAVNVSGRTLEYFNGPSQTCALAIAPSTAAPFDVRINSWSDTASGPRVWSETCRRADTKTKHVIAALTPDTSYKLFRNGALMDSLRSNAAGRLGFDFTFSESTPQAFELKP